MQAAGLGAASPIGQVVKKGLVTGAVSDFPEADDLTSAAGISHRLDLLDRGGGRGHHGDLLDSE